MPRGGSGRIRKVVLCRDENKTSWLEGLVKLVLDGHLSECCAASESEVSWECDFSDKNLIQSRFEADSTQGSLTVGTLEVIKHTLEIEEQFSHELLDKVWSAMGVPEDTKVTVLNTIKSKDFELTLDSFIAACIHSTTQNIKLALDMVCQVYALDKTYRNLISKSASSSRVVLAKLLKSCS